MTLESDLSLPPSPMEGTPPAEAETAFAATPPPSATPWLRVSPWSGWDVLLLVGVTIAASFVFSLLVLVPAQLFIFKNVPLAELAKTPELLLLIQLLAYAVVFAVMYSMLRARAGSFWKTIGWNWPGSSWAAYIGVGAVAFFALASLGRLLPIPHNLPIENFFENARQATLMSVFATAIAPIMEELFFRGFLYPVLARRISMVPSILLTSLAFGMLHGGQLKYSWAAVLIIFLIGVILTTVRARTNSVAASFLVHVGYNGMLSVLLYVGTGGFRHLEKLNQ